MHISLTNLNWSALTVPLSKLNVGTYQEMSTHATYEAILGQLSQLAELLWTDPGLNSEISVCELI